MPASLGSPTIDLSCRGVGKRYRMSRGAPHGGEDFWALRDVTFEVSRGQALGVIGANGAGKSTLLKLLANITSPTVGEIQIRGRLAAMIEVGSGFHPELTGRENIYLSGAILGMRRREIAAKFDRIVAFAGVAEFIDIPVKWYSSGMYVRLGFSVAGHVDPDVLLIDEVLAVGDAAFQAQCLARIHELRQQGTTAIFISHDLAAIAQLCDHVILLDAGRIASAGDANTVIREYRRRLTPDEPTPADHPDSSSGVTITGVTRLEPATGESVLASTGTPLRLQVRYTAAAPVAGIDVELSFSSEDGRLLLCQPTTASRGGAALDLRAGSGSVEFEWRETPLQPGTYALAAVMRQRASQQVLARWTAGAIQVGPGRGVRGVFDAPGCWRHVV